MPIRFDFVFGRSHRFNGYMFQPAMNAQQQDAVYGAGIIVGQPGSRTGNDWLHIATQRSRTAQTYVDKVKSNTNKAKNQDLKI
jgi:hypothetical protein